MRTILALFSFVFLTGCSVHTITNETDLDFEIKKSGGNKVILEAQSCIALDEYFLGLGGDFPFAIRIEGTEDYSKEYSAGHYEITSKKKATEDAEPAEDTKPTSANNTESFELSLSSKNLSCENKKGDENETIDSKTVAMCGDKSAKCKSDGTAKCIVRDNKSTPFCVDKEDKILKDTEPVCDDESVKVECKEKPEGDKVSWKKDNQTRVFCLTGQARCSDSAEIVCIKEEEQSSVPACLKDNEKVSDVDCVDGAGHILSEDGKPKCLQPISVTLATSILEQTVSCGTGGTAECAKGGRPVCGTIPGDSQNQPYCVNQNNIRWTGAVTCSSSVVTPTCGN